MRINDKNSPLCGRVSGDSSPLSPTSLLMRAVAAIALMVAVAACGSSPDMASMEQIDSAPHIFPDYTDVTVPCNIAPLNFMLRDSCEAMVATLSAGDMRLDAKCEDNIATFSEKAWRKFAEGAAGSAVTVQVAARHNGVWRKYRPFTISISPDKIDPYLTYRLIEPDYEVFSRLQIKERNIESFGERILCDYNMVGNRCMNCHTFGGNRGDLSLMYVRGEGGGMILNRNGELRKLGLKAPDMVSGSVYAQFSPSGKYIVFSTNVIIPAFHSDPSKRLEVFDTKSDVYIADIETCRILRSPLLSDSTRLETFPTFSPDGRYVYYCVADCLPRSLSLDSVQYHLCRIPFDEAAGTIGTEVDTLLHATRGTKSSVCHPRVSPDGEYLLYTVADYGTFPIWHPEADLRMLHLKTGKVDSLSVANSDKSDTYHSWSSSGRWFVFASKREDGMYGRPYFCHVAADGTVSKPFMLPQRSPSYYDMCLKSFNIPELGEQPAAFTAADIADAMALPAETFR